MRNKGITLIALVITIIVLIILTGVAINLAIGENGIITRTEEAKKEHEEEKVKEKISIMLTEYTVEKELDNKTLMEFLEKKKANNEIDELIDNKNGTYTIEADGYELTINKIKLDIIKIEKAGLKPKVRNISITTDGTTVAEDASIPVGTPLQINFDHSIDGGTTVVDKTLPYITDGTEQEVLFTITGTVNEQTYTKIVKVSITSKYRELYISEGVKIGDFVNYSVGNWTESDILKLGTSYVQGGALPTTQSKFGGFTQGTSKDNYSVRTEKGGTSQYTGWRVLSKNEDGTINIVHAGTPEGYYHYKPGSTSVKVLKARDWSMYEDCSTDSATTNYAVEGSAHCMTYDEAYNITGSIGGSSNNLRNIKAAYWLPKAYEKHVNPLYLVTGGSYESSNSWGRIHFSGYTYNNGPLCLGVRPVLTLKADIKITPNVGDVTHTTPATAWNLSM